MPKPSNTFTWATDTNHNDPGEAWDGTVTKTAPSAGRQASGWLPTDRPPANLWNWIWNLVGAWLVWLNARVDSNDDWNYETPKTGAIRIAPFSGKSGATSGSVNWFANGPAAGVASDQTEKRFWLDITDRLPDNGAFNQVSARVTPGRGSDGATYRLTSHRIEMKLWEVDHSVSPPTETQLGSTQEDDGTNVEQSLTVTGLGGGSGISVDKMGDKKSWIVEVRSSDDAGTANDEFHYVDVNISVTGPRAT